MGTYQSKNTSPTTSDWLKPTSKQMNGPSTDPIKTLNDSIEGVPHHTASEAGLIHPFNTSSIKIKDTGMIDIYVATNQGIRVDPKTRSIVIMTDTTKIRTFDYRSWVGNHAVTRVRKNHEIYAGSQIIMDSDKDQIQTIGKNWTVKVVGNANLDIQGDMNIGIGKNFNVKAGGHMNFDAQTYNWR